EEQLDAWLLGWALILLHFFALLLRGTGKGAWENVFYLAFLSTLELAGMAFIRASSRHDYWKNQRFYFVLFALGLLFFTALACWNVERKLPYYVATAAVATGLGGLNYLTVSSRSVRDRTFGYSAGIFLVLALIGMVHEGQIWLAVNAILTWLYLVAGVRYWQRYGRKNAGTLVATGGFFAWAMVYPASQLFGTYAPTLHIDDEVWNVPKYIVVVGILLTFLEEQIEKTEHLALHVALTGLPNRRLYEDRLQKALESAERNRSRVAVVVVDLDGFKQINDAHGHATGDAFLRAFAARLQSSVRKADTVARVGGDEFNIAISDVREAWSVKTWVQKLRAEMERPIAVGGLQLHVRGSIGVSVYPDDAQTSETLCACADAAM
ncbi:MAG: diguanylate cyclase domain-containing protein, partial [Acidobacteriaceae bacterium]